MTAHDEFKGGEQTRFGVLLLAGVGFAVALIVVVIVIGEPSYSIPIAVLLGLCAVAAVAYRLVAGSNRTDADSSDTVPKQPARAERPLGDTPEAHDEINPHDLPLDNPGRRAAEEQAETIEGTTRGPLP